MMTLHAKALNVFSCLRYMVKSTFWYCESPQVGDFQDRSSSSLPGLVSKVYGVFGNRTYLQSLGGK